MKNAVLICLSLPQSTSLLQPWRSLMCLRVSVPSSTPLCPRPPSFTFAKVCTSSSQCDSIPLLPLLSFPFLISNVIISGLSCCQLCISPTYQTLSGTFWAYTVPWLCQHNSFICNKAMQHPGQALPLVDVCFSSLSRKMLQCHSSSFM